MRLRWLAFLPVPVILACLAATYEHGLAHFLGVDTQASQNYDFVSGVGPMIIAAIGYAGLVMTALHHLNCHQRGCWRVGRHRVGSGVWCARHHEGARPEVADSARLDAILAELRDIRGHLP